MSARVIVVDDDPMVLKAISVLLTRSGFDVRSANDAQPAMDLAQSWTPDIVVVDYNMPTPGLDLVRKLKSSHGEQVFVAVLTGDDNDEMRERCLAGGADAVLSKPIAPAELRRQLSAAAVALKTAAVASIASKAAS